MKVRIVCATRAARESFAGATALGKSLSLLRPAGVELRLFAGNTSGLPSIYNTAIDESAADPAILLFIHDDVHLCDFHWTDTLNAALEQFAIVGVAGNRRRVARQPGWRFLDERFTRDRRENLSGTVGHGNGFPAERVDVYGPSRQPVSLLDGVMLGVKSETLHAGKLRFDEQFDFHFYDLDLCRQAERAGISMGTCAVSLIHESKGGFGGEGWRRGYERYLQKWGE
ncbi:MAG TPA: glycosyltransferase [Steroidobacteraceae bacterium]|nr:glycosyltransferase [Steroidobacteraceae bacterium]